LSLQGKNTSHWEDGTFASGGRGVPDGLEALELLEVLPDLLPHLGLVQLLGAAGLLDLDGEVVHGPGHHLLPHLHEPLELQHRVGLAVVLSDGEARELDGLEVVLAPRPSLPRSGREEA